jgi:hypothetical protein
VRRLLVAALATGLLVLPAWPAAADTFTPNVDVTLAPGATHELDKTLKLDERPGGTTRGSTVDVLFRVNPANCPIKFVFTPPRFDDVQTPATVTVHERMTAPTTPGVYNCQVQVLVGDLISTSQTVRITVPQPDTTSTSTTTTTTTTTMTTTLAPTTTTEKQEPAPGPSLPFTGGHTLPLAASGALLLAAGTVLALLGRERSRR